MNLFQSLRKLFSRGSTSETVTVLDALPASESVVDLVPAPVEPRVVVLREAAPPAPSAQQYGYRRISGADGRRDLSPVDYDWHLKLCNWLWRQNPIAKKGVQNIRAFVASEGFRVRATSTDDRQRMIVQGLLDEHWQINEWDDELSRRVETLGVEGEWAYYAAAANPHTGHYKMAKILPENIKDITRCPLNAEQLRTVELNVALEELLHDGTRSQLTSLPIARMNEQNQIEGSLLYLGINRLSGQTRGWSDLLVVADYLDVLDKLIFNETDRTKLQRSFAWDVSIKGIQEPAKLLEARDRILKEGPPKPGGLLVHDDSETWECKSPQLNLQESIALLKFVMSICFGGLGMPEHFFSQGGDTNKATAAEMGTPVWAAIRDRKRAIQAFMRLAIRLALYRLRKHGRMFWVRPECEGFQVVSRDPERNAYDLTGKMLGEVGNSLLIGQEARWITGQDAGKAFRSAASALGLGDFHDAPEPENLSEAADQVDKVVEHQRPQLEKQYPLALPDVAA